METFWPFAAAAGLIVALAVLAMLRLMSPDPGARWGFLADRRQGGRE